jgi:hypothetical protein
VNTPTRRAELTITAVALAMGVAGVIAARNLPLTAPKGELVLRFGPSFNPLGAAVVIVLSILGLAGAILGRRTLVIASTGGFALVAVQVLLQFGRSTNWLGSRGSNLSFAVGVAAGLGALVLAKRGR